MSYIDRLRPSIKLTSPDGDEYEAKWIGGERSKEKKLGVFEYPNNNGTRTQDLGINGTRYPLTLNYDGPDNDLVSERFYKSCDQRGPWTVIHPVKGELSLQLVSVTERIQPVESGNITVFDTQWIEPSAETSTSSTAQTASEVQNDSEDTNIASADQYGDNISLDTAADQIANETGIDKITELAENTLSDITSVVSEINSQFLAIKRGIDDTLDTFILGPLILAGQVQQLIQLPALAIQDIGARVDAYGELAGSMFPFLPVGSSSEDKNTVNAFELGLSATVVAACQSIISGPLDSRVSALEYAAFIEQLLSDVTENLENVQENFSDSDIDMQYFSNSLAYNNLAIIVGKTIEYLIDSSLSLKIEKRFTLDRARVPLEITVTEYGSLGDNDENLDFFISTNALTDKQIRLLDAGREVVVYV